MQRRQFNRDEAKAKIGKRVCSNAPYPAVPQGSTGVVVDAVPAGEGYNVCVEWDVKGLTGIPYQDWFSREEYERFLEEIHD